MCSVFHWHCMGQLWYIKSGSLTRAPCLASVVMSLFLLFQDSQWWLPWWKWDTRSVFHWHCMGQHCSSLVMKLTGILVWPPLVLLWRDISRKAIINGSFFEHGLSWKSSLDGLWGYWAITLQCLLSVQLLSSVAHQSCPSTADEYDYWWSHCCIKMKWLARLQKHLSDQSSEGGVEDFWCNENKNHKIMIL